MLSLWNPLSETSAVDHTKNGEIKSNWSAATWPKTSFFGRFVQRVVAVAFVIAATAPPRQVGYLISLAHSHVRGNSKSQIATSKSQISTSHAFTRRASRLACPAALILEWNTTQKLIQESTKGTEEGPGGSARTGPRAGQACWDLQERLPREGYQADSNPCDTKCAGLASQMSSGSDREVLF